MVAAGSIGQVRDIIGSGDFWRGYLGTLAALYGRLLGYLEGGGEDEYACGFKGIVF